jgi:hypothetical protein
MQRIKLLFLSLLFAVSVHAKTTTQSDPVTYRYQVDPNLSGPTFLGFNKQHFYNDKYSYSLSGTMCPQLYREKYQGGKLLSTTPIQYENTDVVLNHFDVSSYNYQCQYVRGTKVLYTFNGTIHGISKLRNQIVSNPKDDRLWSLTHGDWLFAFNGSTEGLSKPQYYDQFLSDGTTQKTLNLSQYANKIDFWDKKGDSITVSDFLINLITLNSDYFKGVDASGNLEIAPPVQAQMQTLTDTSHGVWSSVKHYASQFWDTKGFMSTNNQSANESARDWNNNTQLFSFSKYFNMKLFGLYFEYMNLGWASVFSGGSLMLLLYTFLYSGGRIGARYALHKLQSRKSGSNEKFDFPVLHRILGFGIVSALTLVPIPSGSKINSLQGTGKTSCNTTAAKNIITFFANEGTKMADKIAAMSMYVYLRHLQNATHAKSINRISNEIYSLRRHVFNEASLAYFYNETCRAAFPNQNGFAEIKNTFNVDYTEDPNWQKSASSELNIFAPANQNPNAYSNEKVSLLMCRNMEYSLATADNAINGLYDNLNGQLSSIYTKSDGISSLSSIDTFFQLQMYGLKKLGWIDIVELPVLDIFMQHTGILAGLSDKQTTKEMVKSISTAAGNAKKKSVQKITNDSFSNDMSEMGHRIVGLQVYMIMPGFSDLLNMTTKVAQGGINAISEISSDIGIVAETIMDPVLGLKSLAEKYTSNGNKKEVSTIAWVLGFILAIQLYSLLLSSVFASMISLLIIVKITMYFFDVFTHFFVSPLLAMWQLTTQQKTDKLHDYVSHGLVLYLVKPTLIVFSVMMFIIGYSLMESVYHLIFQMVNAGLIESNSLLSGYIHGIKNNITAFVIVSNVQAFGGAMLEIIGIIMAYKIIMQGDQMILRKFGWQDQDDTGVTNQITDKVQMLTGKM